MAKGHSFNVVSEVDMQEVHNAVNQAIKEIQTRFDFKGSMANITFDDNDLIIVAEDDFRIRSVDDILKAKLIKRKVALKALDYGKVEPATGGTSRQRIKIVMGIDPDRAKKINKFVKDLKLKANTQTEKDSIRVQSNDIDTLQQVIQALKDEDFGIPLQFINYR